MSFDYDYLGDVIRQAIENGMREGFASIPQPPSPTTDEELRSMESLREITEASDIKAERNAANVLLRQFIRAVEKDVMDRGLHPVRPNALIQLCEQAKELLSDGH